MKYYLLLAAIVVAPFCVASRHLRCFYPLFDFIELMIFFNQLGEIWEQKRRKRKEKCSARGEDLYREATEKESRAGFGWILDIKPEPKEHYDEQGLGFCAATE